MITERQEKLLEYLIKEYIDTAEPVSSFDLKKVAELNVSAATVRNDLQELSRHGFIEQPHTSAGRIPTQKAYRYFTEKFCQNYEKSFADFIETEVKRAKERIQNEIQLTNELMNSLSEISISLSYKRIEQKDNLFEILTILGPSKESYNKNINSIREILKNLENF